MLCPVHGQQSAQVFNQYEIHGVEPFNLTVCFRCHAEVSANAVRAHQQRAMDTTASPGQIAVDQQRAMGLPVAGVDRPKLPIERPSHSQVQQWFECWEEDLSIPSIEAISLESARDGFGGGVEWLWNLSVEPVLSRLEEREREAEAQANSRALAVLDAAIALREFSDPVAAALSEIRATFMQSRDFTVLNEARDRVAHLVALNRKGMDEIDGLESEARNAIRLIEDGDANEAAQCLRRAVDSPSDVPDRSAVVALKELVESINTGRTAGITPEFTSALQQARTLLRRHGERSSSAGAQRG